MVLYPIERSSLEILFQVLRNSEISNSKHQIPMKSQMSISNDPNRFDILNFGHCDLFVICYLRFGIFTETSTFPLRSIWPLFRPAAGLNPEPGTWNPEPYDVFPKGQWGNRHSEQFRHSPPCPICAISLRLSRSPVSILGKIKSRIVV